jgi:hypothetical protein
MKLQLEGTQKELDHVRRDLAHKFPDVEFQIEQEPGDPFADRPLGEATILTLILVVVATKLTEKVVEDIYELIKQKYSGVLVKKGGG